MTDQTDTTRPPMAEDGDNVVRLRTLPVDVNVTKIAAGMLRLFTEDERLMLRFGMLPAEKMRVLERILDEKFRRDYRLPPTGGDAFCAMLKLNPESGFDFIDFSLRALINEATAAITSELYQIGDLVV
jgi:hypothetical protein